MAFKQLSLMINSSVAIICCITQFKNQKLGGNFRTFNSPTLGPQGEKLLLGTMNQDYLTIFY